MVYTAYIFKLSPKLKRLELRFSYWRRCNLQVVESKIPEAAMVNLWDSDFNVVMGQVQNSHSVEHNNVWQDRQSYTGICNLITRMEPVGFVFLDPTERELYVRKLLRF